MRAMLLCSAVSIAAICIRPTAHAADFSATVNISTSQPTAMARGLSGFNTNNLNRQWEYYDDNYLAAAAYVQPGLLRYVGGTASDNFNLRTGDAEDGWTAQFYMRDHLYTRFYTYATNARGKGYNKLIDFKTLIEKTGAKATIMLNAFTDSPTTAADLVRFCRDINLKIEYWELANEAYGFTSLPAFFNHAGDYLDKMKPFNDAIKAADPGAKTSIMFSPNSIEEWDNGIKNYPDKYWDAVAFHPFRGKGTDFSTAMASANTALAGVYNEITNHYVAYDGRPGIDVFISAWNVFQKADEDSETEKNLLRGTMFNGIYVAEFTTRLSRHPNVKGLLTHSLEFDGFVPGTSPTLSYRDIRNLVEEGNSTDTSSWQFNEFYLPAGLAHRVINPAVNGSTHYYTTSLTGGATVSTEAGAIPALYAQAYKGETGQNHLVITNKSDQTHLVTINLNGAAVSSPLTKFYFHSDDPGATNTSTTPQNLVYKTSSPSNPVFLPAYSVTRIEWATNAVAPPAPRLDRLAVGAGSASLAWSALSSATGYKIRHGTASGTFSTTINLGNVTSHTVTGLSGSGPYYFVVAASNGSGTGPNSNELSAALAAPSAAPVLRNPSAKDGSVTLGWRSVPNATGYHVRYGSSSGSYSTTIDVGNQIGYTVKGLANNAAKYFAVRAYNVLGNGALSNEITATPRSDYPLAPSNLIASAVSETSTTLTWYPAYADTVAETFEDGDAGGWTVNGGTWMVETDSANPATYIYRNIAGSGNALVAIGQSTWKNLLVEAEVRSDDDGSGGAVGLLLRYVDNNNHYRMDYDLAADRVKIWKIKNGTATLLAQSTALPADIQWAPAAWVRLAFEAKGENLYAYYGSILLVDATDSDPSLAQGKAGLFTSNEKASFDWVNVRTDNATSYQVRRSVTPDGTYTSVATGIGVPSFTDTGLSPNTKYFYKIVASNSAGDSAHASNIATARTAVLSDDFEDGNANGWTVSAGSFAVATDGGDFAFHATATSGNNRAFRGGPWSDVAISSEVKLAGSASGRIGLLGRYSDDQNHYAFYYSANSGSLVIAKRVGGVFTALANKNFTLPTGAYHRLTFELNGTGLFGYVDGEMMLSADDSALSSGATGCYTLDQTGFFDDIAVVRQN